MKIRAMPLLLASLFLAGCSQKYVPEPLVSEIETGKYITSTAALTHTFIHDAAAPQYSTCSQPPPDVAFDQGESGGASFSFLTFGDDNVESEKSSDEVEMAGRTPMLLQAREMYFRTCEVSQNHRLSKDEALALFRETRGLIGQILEIEARNTVGTATSATQSSEHPQINNFIGRRTSVAPQNDTSSGDNQSGENLEIETTSFDTDTDGAPFDIDEFIR